MMVLAIAVALTVLFGSIALVSWIADQERWEAERAEKARVDRELYRADRRLRGLTNRTILSMLEVTRRQDTED